MRSRFPLLLLPLLASSCVHPAAARAPVAAAAVGVLPHRGGTLSYDATVAAPAGAKKIVLWIPVPRQEPVQVVGKVTAPEHSTRVSDRTHANPAIRVELDPANPTTHVEFELLRAEEGPAAKLAAAQAEPAFDGKSFLSDEGFAIADDRIQAIAAGIFKDVPQDADLRARKAFDYVLANMRYAKEGTGWGTGSTAWACDSKYGNCTDFHALFLALIRTGGVPGRFRIGFSLPAQTGAVAGYHCWAEYFSAKNGWVPVDASEAWKHADRKDYLFGHLDPNRIGMSLGRDLVFEGQKGPALNYFVFPYAEADGQPIKVDTKVAWTDRAGT